MILDAEYKKGYTECEGWCGVLTSYMENGQIGSKHFRWYIPGQGFTNKCKKVEWTAEFKKYEVIYYEHGN